MTYAEAKRTASKLFGPGLKLHRGKNRCFLLRPDGLPMGDGRSWLECLRSAGEAVMLKNARTEALKVRLEEFVKVTGWDPEKLTEKQLAYFDVWMTAKDENKEPPPPPTNIVEKLVKLF